MLASFATLPLRARLYTEQSDVREPFERDRDRVIHSIAFRRLQYKTQVFLNHEGDHYRTRLTHSLEVAQISRSIARRFHVNEDLAELVALAHDLGHPPFGHAGEEGLQEASKEHGGFYHNGQTLRVLCYLENRYEAFDGLNLTPESIEGVLKHNGPLDLVFYEKKYGHNAAATITDIAEKYGVDLKTQASFEAQIAAIADDIAYLNHDIDDGIRAGFLELDDLLHIDILARVSKSIGRGHERGNYTFVRTLTSAMISDVVKQVQANIQKYNIKSPLDVFNLDRTIVEASPEFTAMLKELRTFLFKKIYRHPEIKIKNAEAKAIVSELFNRYMTDLTLLPLPWQRKIGTERYKVAALAVLDYIAGMTDRFAIQEYERLSGGS